MISFWIHPLMYPTIFALGSSYINKNGIMTISNLDNPQKILSGLTNVIDKWGFKDILIDQSHKVYVKKNMWGRFWNYIFKEGLEIIPEGDQIILKGKMNTFLQLEYKLKKM